MYKSKIVSACFILTMAFSLNAEAKLYKWVDDKGVTHYGEVIPPEFANKERDSFRKSGLLEKRPEKADPAAILAKEEAEQKRKTDSKAAMEQQRRDSALLNTYSNENEIDQARDRTSVLLTARVDSYKTLLKSSQGTLDDLKKEAENRTKTNKKIPLSLSNDISQSEAKVLNYSNQLGKNEQDLIAVKTRFENEKLLYRKLQGGAAK